MFFKLFGLAAALMFGPEDHAYYSTRDSLYPPYYPYPYPGPYHPPYLTSADMDGRYGNERNLLRGDDLRESRLSSRSAGRRWMGD